MKDDVRPGIKDVKTLYAWVIEDVVTRMRSEFLQEGLDEAVLHELRQVWEEKLEESGTFRADEPEEAAGAASKREDAGTGVNKGQQDDRSDGRDQKGAANMWPGAALDDVIEEDDEDVFLKQEQEAVTIVKSEEALPSYTAAAQLMNKRKGEDNGLEEGVANKRPFLDLNEPCIKQADGAADDIPEEDSNTQEGAGCDPAAAPSSSAGLLIRGGIPRPPNRGSFARLKRALSEQCGDRCTSSSIPGSTMRQVDGEEDGMGDEEEVDAELNEDDDINDDDDSEEQEDQATNFLCAQYEKVNRIKNKWKCLLKDGVFNINGRDYVFRRASTEFQF